MNDTVNKSTIINIFSQPLAANESTSGVIKSTPIEGARSHFRSRIFTSMIGCNPLVSAANVLLAFNEHLKELSQHDNLEQLHADLAHEIRVFESSAQERGYIAEAILIARYVICATLDETITHSSLVNNHLWQQFRLISTFQNEQSADERFFLIIDRLLTAPSLHIDLLELIYTCLSLGFEGKYRYENKGYLQLSALKDNLYQQIRLIREDPPKLLSPILSINKSNDKKFSSIWLVLLKAVAFTIILSCLIYGSYAFIFNQISAPIQTQIKNLLTSE